MSGRLPVLYAITIKASQDMRTFNFTEKSIASVLASSHETSSWMVIPVLSCDIVFTRHDVAYTGLKFCCPSLLGSGKKKKKKG